MKWWSGIINCGERAGITHFRYVRCLYLLAILAAVAGLCRIPCAQAEPSQVISHLTTWDKSNSPIRITGEWLVPAGAHLTIQPGVKILMDHSASLLIEGEITALGSPEEPIIFTSMAENPAPGDWGNIRFITADTTLSYDESGAFLRGSRLEHLIVEYGGIPTKGTSKEYLGGAIHCRKSSPYLRNLTIRYNRGQFGGGIYCHEFASPYIENCLFLENTAIQSGGGLACFFYSNAVIVHNVFQANIAGEHGGGIYFSFSSPQIIDNIIENNSAKYQGGGLHASNTVTRSVSRVRGNVLLDNRAVGKAANLYVTAKIETIFQENCLFTNDGYDVYVEALESDLDFRGNFFGVLGEGDLEARVRDRYDDPAQKVLICDPILEAPPTGLPNAPLEIFNLKLAGDPEFSSEWSFPVCPKAPLYLEIQAADRNPYHADWIPIRLKSSESNPKGVVVLAWETGPATGIFRVQGIVDQYSSAKEASIKAEVGEIIFISIENVTGWEVSRRVDPPQSYVTALWLPQEVDSMHVVNHTPQITWQYRNIFGYKQQRFELQLSTGEMFSATPIWSSGEVQDTNTTTLVKGLELKDGSRYSLRLRLTSGDGWSEWASLSLRMNSLPTIPQLISPLGNQIITVPSPSLCLQTSTDAENDPILYEVQLYQDSAFTRVLAIEKELKGAGAMTLWIPALELKDDAEYFWRARSRDAYETGPWAQTGHFWMNLIEEPPLPFALMDPEQDLQVYHLQPVFSWHRTVDPDPLSKVHYRLLICPDEKFAVAATIKAETDLTFLKVDRPLKNDASYFWKVEAVDNTNRFTTSLTIGRFRVSTTPSIPELAGPFQGEELRPEDRLAWSKSLDPDPEDSIVYRVQITENDFAKIAGEEVVATPGVKLADLINFNTLSDDKEYRVRVRAEDDQGIVSDWCALEARFFLNKINTTPGPISGSMEPDGSVEINPTPLITWGAAADADRSDPNSSLSYLIQFDREGVFQEVFRQVQVMAGVTRINVPGLTDNSRWFFRICARDDEGAVSIWSPIKSFVLNTKNDPPNDFSLTEPTDGYITYQLTGLNLSWQASSDIDPGDQIHYFIYLEPATGGTPLINGKRTNSFSLTLGPGLNNKAEYVWWVEAEDSLGARTRSKEKFHFTVNTTPTTPIPQQIAGGILTDNEKLYWIASTDPDPDDQITYTLQIVQPDNPEAVLLEIPKIAPSKAGSGLGLSDLKNVRTMKDNQRYLVQVRAVDSHGITSDWGGPVEFVLNAVSETLARFALLSPDPNQENVTTPLEFIWEAAKDPDPGDVVTYTLFLAQDIGYTRNLKVFKDLKASKFALSEPLEACVTYFWKVLAQDSKGLQAWSGVGENRSSKFTVAPESEEKIHSELRSN